MYTPLGNRKRRKRYDEPGHAHCLTFSCFHGQSFLKGQRASGWLAESIRAAREQWGFDLWAWVFMPEHVHILLRPRDGTRVGDILRSIKEPVSKKAAYWVRKNAPEFLPRMLDVGAGGRQVVRFWQIGGGYDRNIVGIQELREKTDYIHKNPVRRKLVQTPAEWVWSSYAAWQSGIDEPLPIDRATFPSL